MLDHRTVGPRPGGVHPRPVHRHDAANGIPVDRRAAQPRVRQRTHPTGRVVLVLRLRTVRTGEGRPPSVRVIGPAKAHAVTQTTHQVAALIPGELVDTARAGDGDRATGEVALRPGQESAIGQLVTHTARGVMRPLEAGARRVGPLRQAARCVIPEEGRPPQRVRLGQDPVQRVVRALGATAQGIHHGGDPRHHVVLVVGGTAGGVDRLDHLARSVVPEPPQAVERVPGRDHPPECVVLVPRRATTRLVTLDHPPRRVEARPGPFARRPQLAAHPTVGVVGELVAGTVRVDRRRMPPAGVVLVAEGAAHRMGDRDHPPSRVPFHRGRRARLVGERDDATAQVTACRRGRPVVAGRGHDATQLVVGGPAARVDIPGTDGQAGQIALDGPLDTRRVQRAPQAAVCVVLRLPTTTSAVGELRQAGQPVVTEAPARPVRQLHRRQVAQVVALLGDRAPQRIGRRRQVTGVVVGDLSAVAQRVDDRRPTPTRRVLVAPRRTQRIGLRHEDAGDLVVHIAGAVPQRGDGGHHAPLGVAFEAGRVARGIRGRHEVAELVVRQRQGDARRVGHLLQQATVPDHARHTTGGVGHGHRVGRVTLVVHRGHGTHAVVEHHRLHRAIGLVMGPLEASTGRQDPHRLAATLVELGEGQGTIALRHHHQVVARVIGHRLALPLGVDDAHQPAPHVMDPGVGPRPVGIADGRHIARKVAVEGGAPVRGALGGDPARLVIGVVDLDHTIGVDDRLNQPLLVPAIGTHRSTGGRGEQTARIVVAEFDATTVAGDGGHHPGRASHLGPLQLEPAAQRVLDAHQAARPVMGERQPGRRPLPHLDRTTRWREPPCLPDPARDLEALGSTGQPQVVRVCSIPAVVQATEADLAPVGQGEPRSVVGQRHPALGPRRPAGPEGACRRVQRVVGALQRQQGRCAHERQIDLGLQEVARRRVDRIVRVARRGR